MLGSRLRGKAGESKRRAHLERSLGLSRLYFYSRLVLCVFITGGYRTDLLQQDLLTRSRLACALIKHTSGDENNTLDDEEFREGRDWFEIVHEHVVE